MQLHPFALRLLPALLLSAGSSFTCASALPGMGAALHMLPAIAQAQTGSKTTPSRAQPQANEAVTPITATPVILEHDPQGIAARTVTDSRGNAAFTNLQPGRYWLEIMDDISTTRSVFITYDTPSKSGKPSTQSYSQVSRGQKLAVTIQAGVRGFTATVTTGQKPAPPENVINKGLPVINGQSQVTTQRASGNKTAGSSGTGGVIGFVDGHAVESRNGGMVSFSDTHALGVQKAVGMANVRVLIKNGQGNVVLSGSTAANGSIALKGVKPGTYTLEIDGSSLAASEGKVGSPGGPPSILAVLLMPAENKFTKVGAGRLSVPGIGNETVQSVTRLPYRADAARQGMSVKFTVPGGDSGGGKPAESLIYEFGAVVLIVTGW